VARDPDASAPRRTTYSQPITVLPDTVVSPEERRAWKIIEALAEDTTAEHALLLSSFHDRLRDEMHISFGVDRDKTLMEATHKLAAELVHSAFACFSAERHSVLLDIGSGTARFAAMFLHAGVFERVHAVEFNSALNNIVEEAYAHHSVSDEFRKRLCLYKHKFGDWGRKQTAKTKAIDVAMLNEADAIFLNNYEFSAENEQLIVDAIDQYAKPYVIVVSHKTLPAMSRVAHIIRYDSMFKGAFTYPDDASAMYWVHYLDAYPITVPASFAATQSNALESAMRTATEQLEKERIEKEEAAPTSARAKPSPRRVPKPVRLAVAKISPKGEKTHHIVIGDSDSDSDDDAADVQPLENHNDVNSTSSSSTTHVPDVTTDNKVGGGGDGDDNESFDFSAPIEHVDTQHTPPRTPPPHSDAESHSTPPTEKLERRANIGDTTSADTEQSHQNAKRQRIQFDVIDQFNIPLDPPPSQQPTESRSYNNEDDVFS
jgi:hypothetical protein